MNMPANYFIATVLCTGWDRAPLVTAYGTATVLPLLPLLGLGLTLLLPLLLGLGLTLLLLLRVAAAAFAQRPSSRRASPWW
jgi:hypothetical protein